MKLKPYQQMLVDDGLPLACIATPQTMARARKYWDAHPPVSVPFAQIDRTRDESPETKAFRAQEEERKRLKSLAGIARMKTRFASKAIDYTKFRWDARRNKFVPITGDRHVPAPDQGLARLPDRPAQTKPAITQNQRIRPVTQRLDETGQDWSRLNKDTAETLARLNGVWKDSYEKLRGTGRIVMTVGNILKGIAKRGGMVKWT